MVRLPPTDAFLLFHTVDALRFHAPHGSAAMRSLRLAIERCGIAVKSAGSDLSTVSFFTRTVPVPRGNGAAASSSVPGGEGSHGSEEETRIREFIAKTIVDPSFARYVANVERILDSVVNGAGAGKGK